MGRAPCCDKANVKKGPWSPEEDSKLKEYIEKNGTGGNWIALPQKAGLKRCGKSCRLRWLNYLRPHIKHGEFSSEEDRIICTLFATIGSRWSIIAGQLPGRTDNDVKNYWNTKLKKKLMAVGLVPHLNHRHSYTRKPSSQSLFSSHASYQSSNTLYQSSVLPSSFANSFHSLSPLYMTGTTPPSTLDFASVVPNFSNEKPSSSSVTTDNSLLMNPSTYYPGKDNILMFGSEGSPNSSSDGIKQEAVIGFQNYFAGNNHNNEVEPSIDDGQGFIPTSYSVQGSDQIIGNNFWGEKLNEDFGETSLRYDLEDVKKLIIHSGSDLDTPASVDASKDGARAMYYF
ncbi:hypothetical protein MLD38_011669 [Melastoma candidum]|uniref:Uncharacterized protein n=1 Tax=Melastoma candidum TaxID=119954 RepID=A0ACB9R4X6_9MYRT|nr:hypothetical protein MLD38_011669 [Melastoma candidum]